MACGEKNTMGLKRGDHLRPQRFELFTKLFTYKSILVIVRINGKNSNKESDKIEVKKDELQFGPILIDSENCV